MASGRAARFREYLDDSLEILERECPQHFDVVTRQLRGMAVVIIVGDAEPVRVCLRSRPWIDPSAEGAVTVRIAQNDLVQMLLGHATIEQCAWDGRLDMRGTLDDVTSCLDALRAWLHGAIRSPSLPLLHQRYLAS